MVDVALIGAGPIGIEMAGILKRSGLTCVHLESGQIGNTITRWPRNTQFFSSPEWIAIAGIPIQTQGQEIVTGESYLAYLRLVVETLDLTVHTYETVTGISGSEGDFNVSTVTHTGEERSWRARRVILATGDMNRARTIGVPGEDLPHVTHFWRDPHDYFRRELLIVGGRNSAVEAALRCWRAGVKVTISYRGTKLDEKRLISRLHLELDLLVRTGQIGFLPLSEVREIRPGVAVIAGREVDDGARREAESAHGGKARLLNEGELLEQPADFVYLATGFEMDRSLYEMAGIETRDEERKPVHDAGTMESNVPGLFVVGTSIGGNQRGYKVFITTSHEHCLRAGCEILKRAKVENPTRELAEVEPGWAGNLISRDYPLSSKDVE